MYDEQYRSWHVRHNQFSCELGHEVQGEVKVWIVTPIEGKSVLSKWGQLVIGTTAKPVDILILIRFFSAFYTFFYQIRSDLEMD